MRRGGSLRVRKMCAAPHSLSQSDALATKSTPRRTQNAHRATARAIRPTQSAQRVCFACSKCAPRHSESDLAESKSRACHEIYTQAPKYCARHEICTKSSKMQRQPRKSINTLESAAPVTEKKLATNSKSSKLLDLPRNPTLTRLHARDCGARMISTNVDMFQARQSEPIVRQGQRKRRRRKHYDAPARTLADAFGHARANQRTRPYPAPLNNGNPSLRIREKTGISFLFSPSLTPSPGEVGPSRWSIGGSLGPCLQGSRISCCLHNFREDSFVSFA